MARERLSQHARQEQILMRLNEERTVRIADLARHFRVAAETIRRDLDELGTRGALERTYGGAMRKSLTEEPAVSERSQHYVAERKRIAERASALIEAGDALMIDCGSTTTHFGQSLASHCSELTVVTNCLPVASVVATAPGTRVVVTPGDYSAHETGVYGTDTLEFLRRYRANWGVIGAGGLSCSGPSEVDSRASWIKRAMIERAHKVMLLLDSSKFGVEQFENVCALDRINVLVTDIAPYGALRDCIASAEVQVEVAEPETKR